MNREKFDESMGRVLAFTHAPKTPAEVEHLHKYLNGLYEAVGDMDAYTFEQVTVELCKNMSRGQRPMPGQFRAIYSRLKNEQRASKPVHVCPSCKNTIWNMVRMMETKTGLEMDFAEPCPECQSRHPLKDAPPRDGWIKVELPRSPHDQEMLDKAKAMGPRGAKFVLDMIEKSKNRTNFSDEVIIALVERAGDTPKQENPAFENALNKLKPSSLETSEPAREQPKGDGSSAQKVLVNGEEYEIEE